YQLICPALDEGLSSKQRGKLVREIAAATHTDLSGNQDRPSGGACATEIGVGNWVACVENPPLGPRYDRPVDFQGRLSQTAQAA
ncbi:hypothetical protein, partial [Mycobacterium sp.]|uniref:hypothetical protein n=1 Tax=Mycobacterium sp. TaxID=1785 RepID=UPI003CC58162